MLFGIIGHTVSGDAPAWVLVTAHFIGDRAGGVSGVGKHDRAVFVALCRTGCQPSPSAQREQQLIHCAGFEFVGELNLFGEDLVAVSIDKADIALRYYGACCAVPDHFVRTHGSLFGAQNHISTRRDHFAFGIVRDLVGFEFNIATRIRT